MAASIQKKTGASDSTVSSVNTQKTNLITWEIKETLKDLTSLRWMTQLRSAVRLIILTFFGYSACNYFKIPNPFRRMIFTSYPLPEEPGEDAVLYGKGYYDIVFVLWYIIVFSAFRAFVTDYVSRPMLWLAQIKGKKLSSRFKEQANAFTYFLIYSCIGLYVMYHQDSWWYKTEHLWLKYPHWRMEKTLKYYYLTQFAYWWQQLIVLVLGLEKPRSDFVELVIHHLVTLWLIFWSYLINLTMIGTAIFVSMDVPDVFLAFSKMANYSVYKRLSVFTFVLFLIVWIYMRHYLNICILISVVRDYTLIPEVARVFEPRTGSWLAPWMKWQVFAPILLLQLVNTFWTFLIFRILYRLLTEPEIPSDIRESEDEDEDNKVKNE